MSQLFSSQVGFLWLSRVNAAITFALTLLLVTTLVARRLVLPTRIYILSSVFGICGWIAFLSARVEVLYSPAGILGPLVRPLWFVMLPQVLLVEASVLGWLGVPRPWRYCFLFPVLTGGLLICLLLARGRFSAHP